MSVAIGSLAVFMTAQIATPGPANMALLATGARYGLRAALPFVAGVAMGKQLIIWPLGLGLLSLAQQVPVVFEVLKYASALYICWLAWKVANMRLTPGAAPDDPPGFGAGLVIHPLNPKAWAMVITAYTGFVGTGTPLLSAVLTIGGLSLLCQVILHPLWAYAGERLAQVVAGSLAEPYLMRTLAGLTVLSVLFVLFGGGADR